MKYPSHSHGISYGIYEGEQAKSVTIKVDDVELPAELLTGREVDVAAYLSTDDAGKIQRGTWHTIEIVPDGLTRIVGNLYIPRPGLISKLPTRRWCSNTLSSSLITMVPS